MSALPNDLPLRILDGSPDAILICDRTGTVRYWNAAAERVFGFRAAEALGVSLNLIIPEPLRARHWVGWEASIAEERNAALIVMGPGGGPGFLVPRPGSIAYHVLCVASAPVVVVPRNRSCHELRRHGSQYAWSN